MRLFIIEGGRTVRSIIPQGAKRSAANSQCNIAERGVSVEILPEILDVNLIDLLKVWGVWLQGIPKGIHLITKRYDRNYTSSGL